MLLCFVIIPNRECCALCVHLLRQIRKTFNQIRINMYCTSINSGSGTKEKQARTQKPKKERERERLKFVLAASSLS